MKHRQQKQHRTLLGRIAFNNSASWEPSPITPEELEEWEISFDEDLGDDDEGDG